MKILFERKKKDFCKSLRPNYTLDIFRCIIIINGIKIEKMPPVHVCALADNILK